MVYHQDQNYRGLVGLTRPGRQETYGLMWALTISVLGLSGTIHGISFTCGKLWEVCKIGRASTKKSFCKQLARFGLKGRVNHCCRHLKPGVGWIEQVEIDLEPRCDDGTMPQEPLKQWYEYIRDATSRVGRPIGYNHQTREMLERAGFVEIQEQIFRAPFNTWPRDSRLTSIGRRYCACLLEWIEALSIAPLTTAYGWKDTDVQRLLSSVSKAILNRKIHAYHNMYVMSVKFPVRLCCGGDHHRYLKLTDDSRHIWVARRPEG